MAEASTGMSMIAFSHLYPDLSPLSWENMLFAKDTLTFAPRSQEAFHDACPDQLFEKYYVLSKLQSKQFGQCCLLGSLNFIGIGWLRQSIGRGGLLEISNRGLCVIADGVLAVLYFYAKLFFALPLARLVVFVICCNYFVRRRNERRTIVAKALEDVP